MRRCIVLAAALSYAAPAGASSFPMGLNLDGKTFLLVGVNVGVALEDGDTSWLVGGEASLVRVYDKRQDTPIWIGGYIDTLVDGLHDHARLSIGAEAGYGVIGVDVGPVLELGGDVAGVRARAVLTVGLVTLYGGPVIPLTGSERTTFVELGVLLKLPILR